MSTVTTLNTSYFILGDHSQYTLFYILATATLYHRVTGSLSSSIYRDQVMFKLSMHLKELKECLEKKKIKKKNERIINY